ncbi:hypothetical protein SAMN02910339_01211 [Lachnospiraceae bacterium YSD2013]|nr:hypothetical protein SAMN02910339_01211 [Lachnospiraceae bacterium YSD2013]
MKIAEAQPTYYANRKQLVEQIRSLYSQKEKAEAKYRVTGDTSFAEQAATLELSLDATNKAFEENQKVIDSLMEQWVAVNNMEVAKQQGEAMADSAAEIGKIMIVFRRIASGDNVPMYDERKLMEYDEKMYSTAKSMQALARQLEKREHKNYDSLWDDEEKPQNPDPMEIADNTEFAGKLPDIEIPEVPETIGIDIEL